MESDFDAINMCDDTFQIERNWFEYMHAEGCGKNLLEKVQLIFTPQIGAWLDCVPVVGKLEKLKSTPMYTFADDESKGIVNIPQEWARSVQASRLPSFKSVGSNANLKKIQTLMEAMLKHVPGGASSSTTKAKQTTGRAAMEALFEEIAAKKAAGQAINLGHLKDFDTFNWMLTKEQSTVHKQYIGQCFKDGETRAAPVSQQQEPVPKKKAKTEPGSSSTASLFKRRAR